MREKTMWDKLFELLAVSKENDLGVTVSVHNAPVELALRLVQDGTIDLIEKGAGGNPPTGRIESESGRHAASIFLVRSHD